MNKNDMYLLNAVLVQWNDIVDENNAERHLVTKEEFQQWERFRSKITKTLLDITSELSNDNLKDETRDFLKLLWEKMSNTTRIDANGLRISNGVPKLEKLLDMNTSNDELSEKDIEKQLKSDKANEDFYQNERANKVRNEAKERVAQKKQREAAEKIQNHFVDGLNELFTKI